MVLRLQISDIVWFIFMSLSFKFDEDHNTKLQYQNLINFLSLALDKFVDRSFYDDVNMYVCK